MELRTEYSVSTSMKSWKTSSCQMPKVTGLTVRCWGGGSGTDSRSGGIGPAVQTHGPWPA